MATATVLPPSSHYPPQSSFSGGFPSSGSTANMTSINMISADHRRLSDDNEPAARQSLPSISEVISGTKSSQYPPVTQPSLPPAASSFPPPFTQAAQHHFTNDSDKHSSPQPLHPTSFPSRGETLPAFVGSPRPPHPPPFNGRHSLPPVSERRSTPPSKPDLVPHHRLVDGQKLPEPQAANGIYAHQVQPPPPPPPPSQTAPHAYQPGSLPHGQVPLPGYPISPRRSVPMTSNHYDHRVPPLPAEEMDYTNRPRHDASFIRHFETWNYQDSLSRIGSSSRTIFNFAEAYTRISREQHGPQPIPERLPTEREVSEMIASADIVKRSLEMVKDAVQASMQSDRTREGVKVKDGAFDEDHDVPMYGEATKAQYPMQHEVKKRRGRAAPPGRCHSCNRIDTPEWRRGPDGARTLCNACGLHYAKLERKRQLEARSIRPKPEERS